MAGSDLAKMKIQVESKNVEWDVTDILDAWLPSAIRLNLLEPVDQKIVVRPIGHRQTSRKHPCRRRHDPCCWHRLYDIATCAQDAADMAGVLGRKKYPVAEACETASTTYLKSP